MPYGDLHKETIIMVLIKIHQLMKSVLKVSVRKTRCPWKEILVVQVFSLQRQVIYQIKAKRLNYLIKDFILSNFKRCLSFLLSNSELSSLLLKLQPFRLLKYSLPFYCIWLTHKRPKKGCEEICMSRISRIIALQPKKLNLERDLRKETDIKRVTKGNQKISHILLSLYHYPSYLKVSKP